MHEQLSQKSRNSYPEIQNIGKDLHALKTDVGELAHHVKEDGINGISEFAHDNYKNIAELRGKIENHIKEKPAQSIAIAFATGLIANYFLSRR